MRTYPYLFYTISEWNLRSWGAADLPQFNTAIWLSLCVTMNVASAASLTRVDGPSSPSWVALFVLSFALHYALFIRGGRYARLRQEFEDESPPRLLRLVPWLYAFGSPALFLSLVASREAVAG